MLEAIDIEEQDGLLALTLIPRQIPELFREVLPRLSRIDPPGG